MNNTTMNMNNTLALLLIGLKAVAIIALVVGLLTIIYVEISQRITLRAIRKVKLPSKLQDKKIPLPLTVVDHTHCPGVLPEILGDFIQNNGAGVSCIIENLHPKLGMKDLLVFVKRGEVVLQTIYLPARFLGEFLEDKVLGIRKLLWFLSWKYSKA